MFLNFQHLIENAVGHVELVQLGERNFLPVAAVESDDVRVRVEAGAFLRDIIRDNHVRGLALQLTASVFRDCIRLRRETDEDLIPLLATEFREDIRRRLELLSQGSFATLNFFRLRIRWTIVGHGSRHDDDAGLGSSRTHRVVHLRGAAYGNPIDPIGNF